jgi:hypothetical protein
LCVLRSQRVAGAAIGVAPEDLDLGIFDGRCRIEGGEGNQRSTLTV